MDFNRIIPDQAVRKALLDLVGLGIDQLIEIAQQFIPQLLTAGLLDAVRRIDARKIGKLRALRLLRTAGCLCA